MKRMKRIRHVVRRGGNHDTITIFDVTALISIIIYLFFLEGEKERNSAESHDVRRRKKNPKNPKNQVKR